MKDFGVFFSKISNFWAWAFGVLLAELLFNTHFGTVSSLSMFSINQPLFLQKTKPLNPHPKQFIWHWYLNLGYKEFDALDIGSFFLVVYFVVKLQCAILGDPRTCY